MKKYLEVDDQSRNPNNRYNPSKQIKLTTSLLQSVW